MMKLLITGGSGFIGRNLTEYLASGYSLSAPSSAELDLLDEDAVRRYLRAGGFDVVIHCATTRSNRKLGAPPDLLERNCRMFFNLARNEGLFGKLLYFGSGAEYDRRDLPPRVPESYFDTHVPQDTYGFSKYICAKYAEVSDRIFNLRLFGVFGKYEAWEVRFISNACCRVLHGMPIVIRQNVRFDYLYIEDLANLVAWFIEHEPQRKAYNVCSGTTFELTALADMVASVSGAAPEIIIGGEGMGPEYSGDNAILMQELGAYDFREMSGCIAELYSWYAARQQVVEPRSLCFDE